jgi:hypothetical protein
MTAAKSMRGCTNNPVPKEGGWGQMSYQASGLPDYTPREKETALAEKEERRHGILLAWTLVAALAGIVAAIGGAIAAWPVVKEWLT